MPDEKKLIADKNNIATKLSKMADEINGIVRDIAKGIEHKDYDKKVKEYDEMKNKLTKLDAKISDIVERKSKLDLYINNLKNTKVANKWTEDLWGIYFDRMIIFNDKVDVKFNSGETISIKRI